MRDYLDTVVKQFQYYKLLADKAIARLTEPQLFWQYNAQSNSVAIIIRHLSGNMVSRFTDFLKEDGEKSWRNRDMEFSNELCSKSELLATWEKGWTCLFKALSEIDDSDLNKIVYIRNQGHTVSEAINRQLAHYPYHVGQLVYIAKMIVSEWESLSIPLNASAQYNARKFSEERSRGHFTDEFIGPDTASQKGANNAE